MPPRVGSPPTSTSPSADASARTAISPCRWVAIAMPTWRHCCPRSPGTSHSRVPWMRSMWEVAPRPRFPRPGQAPARAGAALDLCRRIFPSVNADLIFGTPGDGGWQASVGGVLRTGIDHLSVYALTVERGTALSRAVASGAPAPDPDDQADAYLLAQAAAEAAGLGRHETSNYP